MKALKIKTLPKYLKENIEVDLTNLELNGNIRVEDVKLENYEILNSPRIPLASVVLTRQLKQEKKLLLLLLQVLHQLLQRLPLPQPKRLHRQKGK